MQQMPQQTAMQQAMPVGAPAQSNKGGLGALAAQRQQGGQADPRLMAMMQAFQNQDGGMRTQPAIHMGQPGGFGQAPTQAAMQMGTFGPNDMPSGTMPYDPRKPGGMMPGGMPTQQDQQAMFDQIRQANPMVGQPQMPAPQMPGMAAPGGGLLPGAQRPLPVGAGGKGAGMPRPGVPVQRPMPYDPRKPGGMMDVPVQLDPRRPMPMPLPPGLNRPMPMPLPPGLNRPMPMPVPKPAPQPARPTPKPVNPRFNQIMPFLR